MPSRQRWVSCAIGRRATSAAACVIALVCLLATERRFLHEDFMNTVRTYANEINSTESRHAMRAWPFGVAGAVTRVWSHKPWSGHWSKALTMSVYWPEWLFLGVAKSQVPPRCGRGRWGAHHRGTKVLCGPSGPSGPSGQNKTFGVVCGFPAPPWRHEKTP